MDSHRSHSQMPPDTVRLPPRWATETRAVESEAEAAFLAGAALNSLDEFVVADPVWAGCWRDRQALQCASVAVRLMGRNEDEAALRDAVLLSASDGEPGPAGNIYKAFQQLTSKTLTINSDVLTELAELLSISVAAGLDDIAAVVDAAHQSKRPPPFIVAELVSGIVTTHPNAEILAWWLADWVLAQTLRWERPVPLLMAERYGPAFRTLGGRGRVRPGEAAFPRAVCLALVSATAATLQSARDIGRRAEHLTNTVPKIRTKGRDVVIRQILTRDAVLASAPGANLSRWASSRLFERLESFGAVRELSGRPSFKVYGL